MSVTNIGANAFLGAGIVKIGTTSNVKFVGDRAFEKSQLAQFNFNSVESIGIGAFSGTKLKAAELPSTLNSLGEQAFLNCQSLAKVTLSENMTSIGKSTFEGCQALTSIEIPTSVTAIWDKAFYNSGLVTVNVGNNVTEIGSNAFVTETLTSISLGSGVKSLDNTPLFTEGMLRLHSVEPPILGTDRLGCTPTVVIVPKGSSSTYLTNTRWKQYNIIEEGNDVIVYLSAPGALTSDLRIKQVLASKVTSLVIVTNPEKGTLNDNDWASIRTNMTSLIKLDISDTDVADIPAECFMGKKILTEIALPKNVKTIGDRAFKNCTLLGTIDLPSTLTGVGESAFEGCNSMAGDIVIPANCSSLGAAAFLDCYALNNVDAKASSLTSIEDYTFANCRSLDDVALPSGVKTIGESAFAESGIFTINFPGALTTIDDNAFEGCFYLSSVSLPASLQSIGSRAFAKTGLVGVTLPAAISTVENETFSSCDDLRYVNLSTALKNVGDRALASPSISAISSPATVPPTTGFEPFEGVNNNTCSLSIPSFSFNEYISAPYWGSFGEVHDNLDVTMQGNPQVTYTSEEDYQALLRGSAMKGIKGRMGKKAFSMADINISDFALLFDGAQMFIPEGMQIRYFFLGDLKNYSVEYNGQDVTGQIDTTLKSWLSPEVRGLSRLKITFIDENSVEGIRVDFSGLNGNVYDATGRIVLTNATIEQVNTLTPGLYIFGGQKVLVK